MPILIALASICNGVAAFADTTADKAVADIVKAQTKLHSLRSLTADVTVKNMMNGVTHTQTGTVRCLKPNYLWIDMKVTPGAGRHAERQYHISDGKHYCSNDEKGRWMSVDAAPNGSNFRDDLLLWSDFYVLYATDNAKRVVGGADVSIDNKSIDGHPYEVITAVHKLPHPMTMRVYIAQSDGLIHGMTVDSGPMHMDDTWSNIKMNAPLKAGSFRPEY
jgi:outer membrane lipoprotein-sorting protein